MVTNAAEAVESELNAIDAANWKPNKTTIELQHFIVQPVLKEGCEMLCWPALSGSSIMGVATVTFAADTDNYDAK